MAKHILLDRVFERTADELAHRLRAEARPGARADIWLFEDLAKRRAMQEDLARHGVQARVFCAYKPLVHYFLEQVDPNGLVSAHIVYPRHPDCAANRFLLEAYPLADLFPGVAMAFAAAPNVVIDADTTTDAAPGSCYEVALRYTDRAEDHKVFAPNVIDHDVLGRRTYTPSAWLVLDQDGAVSGTAIRADYTQAYHAVMAAVAAHDWGHAEPYFDRLTIALRLPGVERTLGVGHETMSTTEAMHEEIYFSVLEYFQHYSGRPPGSRGLQPGQIVPEIYLDNRAPAHATITVRPAAEPARSAPKPPPAVDAGDIPADGTAPGDAQAPLSLIQVEKALRAFPGRHFAAASRQGRAVNGVHIRGDRPAVLISGAQHANETSGVAGALRAAEQLKTHPGAHFVLMPVENPDGYVLHQALCAANPTHMHHAARYTALGDDVEYREHAPWYERAARDQAFRMSGAQLHLNLHGYPAHEWTRPCTGYLPRGFEMWSLPKGFFLILRYKQAWRDTAVALLRHVTQGLQANARLLRFNREQLERYQRYCGAMPFQVENGMACTAIEFPGQAPGVTLITEFPDETIYGEDFAFAHDVQRQTAVLACEWWWANRIEDR